MAEAGLCHSDDHIGGRGWSAWAGSPRASASRLGETHGPYQKRPQGAVFGACSPSKDIPALLELYRQGQLKLDELITTRYTLDDINSGNEDMRSGRNIRRIIARS